MKKYAIIITIISGMLLFGYVPFASAAHRFGGGVSYWTAVDEVAVRDGFAFILSYQNQIAPFKFEADLEILDEGYAGSENMVFAPQAYCLIGWGVYGGVGIGIKYSDGEFADSPFFALRAGMELEVLPFVFLDLNANYRFESWDFSDSEDHIETDAMAFAAIVRLEF